MAKVCTICKEDKELAEFYKEKRNRDGLRSECKSCYRQRYYSQEKNRKYKRVSYQRHKESIKKYKRQRFEERYRSDIQFRLAHTLRSRLRSALKNNQKTGSAVRDLGCSIEELKEHLESQFDPKMSWRNYGDWHIDHVVPLASFDLTDKEQLKRACHYTNLQPLWAEDNITKGGIEIPWQTKA